MARNKERTRASLVYTISGNEVIVISHAAARKPAEEKPVASGATNVIIGCSWSSGESKNPIEAQVRMGDLIQLQSGSSAIVREVLGNGTLLVDLDRPVMTEGKPVNQAIVKPITRYAIINNT